LEVEIFLEDVKRPSEVLTTLSEEHSMDVDFWLSEAVMDFVSENKGESSSFYGNVAQMDLCLHCTRANN
jgi:hypothetical protein